MKFTVYRSTRRGEAKNTFYPIITEVTDNESLKRAAETDHVCAEYKNNRRSNENFISADVIPLDCDNTHSDEPDAWITPADIAVMMPDTAFAVVYSRNNMKPKNGKSARPKFHVYFPVPTITDAKEYAELKNQLITSFPFFDNGAKDSARFLFGVKNPQVEIFNGERSVIELLNEVSFEEWDERTRTIPEGKRNNTMSHIAGKIIKRFGNTNEAHEIFLERAAKCSPPLADEELASIWNSAVKFGAKLAKSDSYIPPEEFNKPNKLKPSDYTDIGQAKVLAREYEGELVYTESTDYMRYDGMRWVESKQYAVGACEDFLDSQLIDALSTLKQARTALESAGVSAELIDSGGRTLEKAIDSESAKAYSDYTAALSYKAFVLKRRDMKYVMSALQAAKPMLLKNILDFDSHENLLNTPDGTYDLRYGVKGRKEHSAADGITKATAVSPDRKNMDLWLDTVERLFCGDKELIDYVQEIVGLALIGKVYEEALIIAYGEGSNGKSTFWNAIAKVLGNYSGNISADALTAGCRRNVKPEMAELKGKRLVIASELEEGVRLSTSIVKQLCSTDEVGGEKKYKDPFSYTPTHTLVLYTNHLPKVGANDAGIWRRLIVIPFNAKITGKSDIKNFADYLVENAGGAILTWAIEGAERAIAKNHQIEKPTAVREAIENYRGNNDWLSQFLEECCDVDPTYLQKSGELYQEYRAYCQRLGEYTRSTTDFYTALENIGFERRRLNNGRFVLGIRIKPEFFEE